MTRQLGRRAFHGALARHSPYRIAPVRCVVCSRVVENALEILDAICNRCYRLGWRAPHAVR